ncbi:MAG TPA: YfhO family protein, partial [Armatimonadota bacterium]|nr:YfhO family protein [Armatimonadota bacterium]
QVRWVSSEAERIVLEVESPGGGWLVLSDYNYPGWRARVDGELTPIYRANVIARAVRVPPGRHEVVFTYEPLSWEQGILVSSLSLAVLLGLIGLCLRRRRYHAMKGTS